MGLGTEKAHILVLSKIILNVPKLSIGLSQIFLTEHGTLCDEIMVGTLQHKALFQSDGRLCGCLQTKREANLSCTRRI